MLDDKILRFYRKKIKGDRETKTHEENSNFLDLLVRYAEIYEKIINYSNHREWWEQNWSWEMFKVVSDISLLDRKELISLILAAHFQFQEKPPEEKSTITKELKKLIIYLFRAVIIRGKDESVLRGIRTNTLKMISEGNPLLFEQEIDQVKPIIQEFQSGSEQFYSDLQRYRNKRNKEWGIEKFILLAYYQKKIEDKRLKMDWSDYEVKQLVSQNLEIKEIGENWKSLGNLTLMKIKDDYSLFPWNEKKINLKRLGNDCLMNFEEESWIEVENIIDLIAERERILIEDFKRLQIFESD